MSVIQELAVSAAKSEEQERKWCEDDVRQLQQRLENMRTFLAVASDLPQPDECHVGESQWSNANIESRLVWRFRPRSVYLVCYRKDSGEVHLDVKTVELNDCVNKSLSHFCKRFILDDSTYVAVADVVRQQIRETEKWYEEEGKRKSCNNNNNKKDKANVIEQLEASAAASVTLRHDQCERYISCIRLFQDNMTHFWELAGNSLRRPTRCIVKGLAFGYWNMASQLGWTTGNRHTSLTCTRDCKDDVIFTVKTTICVEDETTVVFSKTFALGDNADILQCLQQQLAT